MQSSGTAELFPACAGVIPTVILCPDVAATFPRVCGGNPVDSVAWQGRPALQRMRTGRCTGNQRRELPAFIQSRRRRDKSLLGLRQRGEQKGIRSLPKAETAYKTTEFEENTEISSAFRYDTKSDRVVYNPRYDNFDDYSYYNGGGAMNFIQYNPNPRGNRVGDCVIRAISGATGRDWETTYAGVSACGFEPTLRLCYLISLHRSIPWALRRSPIVLGGQSAV